MTVARCQYVIEDGRQCVYQAEKGELFCKHPQKEEPKKAK